MSTANDLTRRLIADFFAARVDAMRCETDRPRPTRQDANPLILPPADSDSSPATDLGDPGGPQDSEVN